MTYKQSMKQLLVDNGFAETRTVKYTTEYKRGTDYIYVVNEQPLSFVASPSIQHELILKYNGYIYHASSLREFPKKMNDGERPIHYGYKFNFKTLGEVEDFIKRL